MIFFTFNFNYFQSERNTSRSKMILICQSKLKLHQKAWTITVSEIMMVSLSNNQVTCHN